MKAFFLALQLATAIGLISLILLQNSKGGLQTQVGGSDFYRTKRGAERIVFIMTIGFAIAFFFITVINVFFIK